MLEFLLRVLRVLRSTSHFLHILFSVPRDRIATRPSRNRPENALFLRSSGLQLRAPGSRPPLEALSLPRRLRVPRLFTRSIAQAWPLLICIVRDRAERSRRGS